MPIQFGVVAVALAFGALMTHQAPSAAALFDLFRTRDFAAFEARLETVTDFERIVRDIKASPFGSGDLAEATFLLELTAAALRQQVRPARPRNPFLTWGRLRVQEADPREDYLPLFAAAYDAMLRAENADHFKRLWASAAVSLLQGANESPVQQAWPGVGGRMLGSGYDLGKDGGYLDRLTRYLEPADVLFAEAAISEAQVWTRVNYDLPTYAGQPIPRVNHFYTRVEGAFKRSLDRAEASLDDARKLPEVAAEATVRMGAVRLARATPESREAAVALFREAQTMKAPPDIAYLAFLFEGKALDRPGTLAEGIEPNRGESAELERLEAGEATVAQAIQAYRRALEIMPQAYSVRIALAGALFRSGEITEAAALVNLALSQPDIEADPWSLFWSSQYRHWPVRLAALRDATR